MRPIHDQTRLWEIALESRESQIALPPEWPELEDVDEIFPDYEVIEVIGAGGMGVVYRALQARLGRDVALKLISLGGDDGVLLGERLEKEARIIGRLTHPNIIPVHDFGVGDRFCWLAMECVAGENLGALLKSQTELFSPPEVARIAGQILGALVCAHESGVIHRDVKPSNILIESGNGRVRMIDFGISRWTAPEITSTRSPRTRTGTLFGTEDYTAPEILEYGSSTIADERSDIYSFGVVVYEMLTGTFPRGMFPMPSTISDACEASDAIVAKCLARSPDDRFQTAAEVAAAFAPLETEEGSAKKRTSPPVDRSEDPNSFHFHNLLLAAGIFAFFFECFFVASGDDRFSFIQGASRKQFHSALALTALTLLFNVLWTLAVVSSWRKQSGRMSLFATIACTTFVVLGNSLIVYLAVSD